MNFVIKCIKINNFSACTYMFISTSSDHVSANNNQYNKLKCKVFKIINQSHKTVKFCSNLQKRKEKENDFINH